MTESEAQALLPELASSDSDRRLRAAVQLGVPGWSFAVPELMRLAKSDPDERVRRASISSLASIGDMTAYPFLESLWKDHTEDSDVRQEALEACDRMLDLDGSHEDTTQAPSRPRGDSQGGT